MCFFFIFIKLSLQFRMITFNVMRVKVSASLSISAVLLAAVM